MYFWKSPCSFRAFVAFLLCIFLFIRQYFGYGLMGILTLIPVLNIVGICCGCLCGGSDVIPTKRGCGSSCGGCLMMMLVSLLYVEWYSMILGEFVSLILGLVLKQYGKLLISFSNWFWISLKPDPVFHLFSLQLKLVW